MTVDAHGIPVSSLEAHDLIVGHREARGTIDRDAVIVKKHDQLSEPQVTCKRDGLVAEAFHKAAVPGDDIGVVIDDFVTEPCIQHALCERHTHGVGKPLPKRTRRRLDSGRMTIFGVTGRLGAQLAKILQLLKGHPRIAREVEQRIEQHRTVARRQNETVAVRPTGFGRIETQRFAKEHGRHISHAHGHAGVTRLGSLHGIHGQRPDGIRHILMPYGLRLGAHLSRLAHLFNPLFRATTALCFGPPTRASPV